MRKPNSSGDPLDVERACKEHWQAMYRVCIRILRNPHDAQDATQNAVATAIANPPERLEKGWREWLCTVARNEAVK